MNGRDAPLPNVETTEYTHQCDRSKGRCVARLVEEVEGLSTKGLADEEEDLPASVRSTGSLMRRGPARKAGRAKLEGSEGLKVCFSPPSHEGGAGKGGQGGPLHAMGRRNAWSTAHTCVCLTCFRVQRVPEAESGVSFPWRGLEPLLGLRLGVLWPTANVCAASAR